jgi:hypothetical protein
MDIFDPDGFFHSFPRLKRDQICVTSSADGRYNCIAWAAGQDRRWWWPSPYAFWPVGAPRNETVEAFLSAYGTLGFLPTNGPALELGKRKIAIYTLEGAPKHAARQLDTGRWTSKCGRNVDLEHDLEDLEGPLYGKATHFLARPK